MQALLELDCIPSGMELFPAANEEQWGWIQRVIDESDYYLVITAGKYGTLCGDSGISYTEMEYDYALSSGKPIMAFLHRNIGCLSRDLCDMDVERREALTTFRKKLEKRLCRYWETPSELGGVVSRSITQMISRSPAEGWVRADDRARDDAVRIQGLEQEIESLRTRFDRQEERAIEALDTKSLCQGRDHIDIYVQFRRKIRKTNKAGRTYWTQGVIEGFSCPDVTWDDAYQFLGVRMLSPLRDNELDAALDCMAAFFCANPLERHTGEDGFEDILLADETRRMIIIQFRALGLINRQITSKEHGPSWVRDREPRWRLTRRGDDYLTVLIAARRPEGPRVIGADCSRHD